MCFRFMIRFSNPFYDQTNLNNAYDFFLLSDFTTTSLRTLGQNALLSLCLTEQIIGAMGLGRKKIILRSLRNTSHFLQELIPSNFLNLPLIAFFPVNYFRTVTVKLVE